MGEPRGPMLKGMTYIVRPLMQPENKERRVSFIWRGCTQLFVGPASGLLRLQMKVRFSTRATSLGSERARKEFGRFSGLRRIKVPDSTICSQRDWYSSSEPSHQ